MIAFCKYIKGINTGGRGRKNSERVLLKLKDNVGTGATAGVKLEIRRQCPKIS